MTGIPMQVVNKGITPATKDVFGRATSGPTASLPPRPQADVLCNPISTKAEFSSWQHTRLISLMPVSAGTQSSASLSRPSHLKEQTSRFPAQTSATGVSPGAGNSASSQSHMSWPRMTQTDVQKYTNIFVKVDTDSMGKSLVNKPAAYL
ncbi:actin cytoskeleton-regulatory complex protein pan1-like [Pyrus ussuriensis x Pyrus communis]|uniref:Actin cytoskeleton-regulatory complex protein pan1-like n=1 Tax=Pyrus ussuriensis x Pyrus communis TaxID=2448454 RepID=A0A5N5I718_9ROSA|nr:actin cytoskeleton-regulatory complex protein pan1-like [Pyrus ussuriensis x Pyrus communis]